jgi:hypothetical protein
VLHETVPPCDPEINLPKRHKLGHILRANDLNLQALYLRGRPPDTLGLVVSSEIQTRITQGLNNMALLVAIRQCETKFVLITAGLRNLHGRRDVVR